MRDERVEKLAMVLVRYSLDVQKGDRVLVQGGAISAPLIKAVYGEIIKAGGHPMTFVKLPGMGDIFFQHASEEQLTYIHEPMKMAMETYDAGITVMGSSNTKAMTNADPAKMQAVSRAQTSLMQTMMGRIADGSFRWVGTQFPTNANAQDAEMSLREYEDLIFSACLPDMSDPVGYWRGFSAWQQKIVDWLKGRKKVQVLGKGTDLTLSIEGRDFMNCDGKMNMPDGEVCTSPIEDSAQGEVTFNYPTVYQGREFDGVHLQFVDGKVVSATATKGEENLNSILDTDPGARFLGEFAIGTNKGIQNFTRSILLDEKIGGSFHLAVGMGLPEAGGQNKSAIHWDMICDLRKGGRILVDGKLIYSDGKFTLDF